MRQDIIDYLQKEIKRRCELPSNFFGMGCFYHIRAVVDADAISHFDNVPSLLYLAYVKRNLDIDERKEFVKAKLMRSYEKLSKESKSFYRDKFEQVMSILN